MSILISFLSVCTLLPDRHEGSSQVVQGPPLPDHPEPLDPTQATQGWGLVPG